MAKTLLEALRTRKTGAPATVGATDTTRQVQDALRAKSGRAVSGGGAGPARSSIGEQAAATPATLAQEQLGQQQQVQDVQFGLQQQDLAAKEKAARSDIGMQRQRQDLKMKLQTQSIMNDLERSGKEMDTARYQTSMEQLGINLRLQNKKYLDELNMNAAQARLTDELEFNEALQKSIFSDLQDIQIEGLEWSTMMNASNREFREQLANININSALRMAEDEAKAANTRAIYEGASTVHTAHLEGLDKVSKTDFKTEDTGDGNS